MSRVANAHAMPLRGPVPELLEQERRFVGEIVDALRGIGAWALSVGAPGLVGMALGTVLTHWSQHRYWRRERRVDVKLSVIREFNRLSADYITGVIASEEIGKAARPGNDFFRDLQMVKADCRALFGGRAYDTYKGFEKLVGPRSRDLDEVVAARDRALAALYADTVP